MSLPTLLLCERCGHSHTVVEVEPPKALHCLVCDCRTPLTTPDEWALLVVSL